jgi:steroid delta-isomerase-like uncharacterized protein
MSENREEQLIRELAAAWSAHDRRRVAVLFTDDCIYEDVNLGMSWKGQSGLAEFMEMALGNTPDFKVEMKTCFAANGFGGTEHILSGTPQKDLNGKPLSGKSFSVRGCSVYEFRDGLIYRNTDYWDMGTAMRQMGAIT